MGDYTWGGLNRGEGAKSRTYGIVSFQGINAFNACYLPSTWNFIYCWSVSIIIVCFISVCNLQFNVGMDIYIFSELFHLEYI